MANDPQNRPPPLEQPHDSLTLTEDGRLTEYGIQLMESLRDWANGSNRLIPCSAITTGNFITLTPNEASPIITGYLNFDCYTFVADLASTGVVTATVAPKTGLLDILNVYKTDGAAQATTGDIVADSLYLLFFSDHLNSGNGGLVIK